jgi:hypothetical protein
MGTKRVGLARIEALMENLKRELAMGGASLSGLALSKLSTISDTAGSDLANNASAVTFTTADHGKIFDCVLTGNHTKQINLPASTTIADVGTKIVIVQKAEPSHNSMKLDIRAHTGNIFSANSRIKGFNSSKPTIEARPNGTDENKLVISCHSSACAWSTGAILVVTCVAAGKWQLDIDCGTGLGAGNAGFAFTAV